MSQLDTLIRRELSSYFATPIAYVFILIFLVLAGVFTFFIGNFFEREQADLTPFFSFHPWLYLFLVPAVSMRMWAEERKSGSIELLLTLPITRGQAITGKFIAAWLFTGLALVLTFPLWLTVNFLGDPDNGVILASYLGSWLMVGSYLAIGSCMSALSRNQVVAFILSGVTCLFFILLGFPVVVAVFSDLLPLVLVDGLTSLSFLTHFNAITKGVLAFRDLLFFVAMMVFWLAATAVVLEMKQAD